MSDQKAGKPEASKPEASKPEASKPEAKEVGMKQPVGVEAKVETKDVKPIKKGWSNPALKMMGIPRISMPSRNWLIFWGVLAGLGGAYYYDRTEQTKIRTEFMKKVDSSGEEKYETNKLPRKLTIFIAPPPNDFLETTMVYFRRYVKPILNAASLDFDILVANSQGDIRTSVSERIRQMRRDEIKRQKELKFLKDQQDFDKSWTKLITITIPKIIKLPFIKEEIIEEHKNFRDLYTPQDLVGFYYNHEPIAPIREDSLNPEKAGGVVCFGRGAFKEFVQGVHEGLLGPLDPPVEPVKPVESIEPIEQPTTSSETSNDQPIVQPKVEENLEDKDEEENKAVKPYIYPKDYSKSEIAPEFQNLLNFDKNNVPVFFEQPIYVFPIPNLLGFKNIPINIYKWFNKRTVAQEFSERTMHIIENKSRQFELKDSEIAIEEELIWPKKWVETGKSKNSEWVQEMGVDERVIKHFKVYE